MAGDDDLITWNNASSTTITITGLENTDTTNYIWIDGSTGNIVMDPLEQMKQEFEALANLFFQENYDVNFVGFPTPPDFQMDKLMSANVGPVACIRNVYDAVYDDEIL